MTRLHMRWAVGAASLALPFAGSSASLADGADEAERLLSAEDCAFIAAYDARWFIPDFRRQLIHQLTTSERCSTGACPAVTRRFTEPIYPYFADFAGSRANAIAREAYDATLGLLSSLVGVEYATPIPGEISFPVLSLIAYSSATVQAVKDSGDVINPTSFDLMEARNMQCFGSVLFSNDAADKNGIFIGQVFIREDVGLNVIPECVLEEVVNAFGLTNDPIGDASLFDDEFDRPPPDAQGRPQLSPRETIMLRILYAPELPAGSDPEALGAFYDRIHARDCG